MVTKKKRKRRHFTPEYRAEVVRLVRTSGKTAGEVARDLDLTETSVRAWVRQADVDAGRGPSGADDRGARRAHGSPPGEQDASPRARGPKRPRPSSRRRTPSTGSSRSTARTSRG